MTKDETITELWHAAMDLCKLKEAGAIFTADWQRLYQALEHAEPDIFPTPVDRLNQGYEKVLESRPLVQPKQYGRRSTFGYHTNED